jgi:hypothetical protein
MARTIDDITAAIEVLLDEARETARRTGANENATQRSAFATLLGMLLADPRIVGEGATLSSAALEEFTRLVEEHEAETRTGRFSLNSLLFAAMRRRGLPIVVRRGGRVHRPNRADAAEAADAACAPQTGM